MDTQPAASAAFAAKLLAPLPPELPPASRRHRAWTKLRRKIDALMTRFGNPPPPPICPPSQALTVEQVRDLAQREASLLAAVRWTSPGYDDDQQIALTTLRIISRDPDLMRATLVRGTALTAEGIEALSLRERAYTAAEILRETYRTVPRDVLVTIFDEATAPYLNEWAGVR